MNAIDLPSGDHSSASISSGERDQRAQLAAVPTGSDEQLRALLLAVAREREEPTVGRPARVAVSVGTGAEGRGALEPSVAASHTCALRTVRREVGRRDA